MAKRQTRFDDGKYKFPSIYEEAKYMIAGSNIIYTIANMRDLEWKHEKMKKEGKEGSELVKFDDPDFLRPKIDPNTNLFLTGLPIHEIAIYASNNLNEIKKDKEFYEKNQETLECLRKLSKKSWGELLYIDDSEGDEREIVYGISIDHANKRVIVTFRGTSVLSDMLTDALIKQKTVELPNSSTTVKLHTGFYNYLFSKYFHKDKKTGKVDNLSKYDSIIKNLIPVLANQEGYKLYVTGHSLGGALASLFALCASNDGRLSKPVTCISVASPYCGDEAWRSSFMQSEKEGNLRHLRIANETDIIPHLAPTGFRPSNLYKHAGINLRLQNELFFGRFSPNPRFHFQYPGGIISEIGHAFTNSFVVNCGILPSRILKMHGCPEYGRRLKASKAELKNLYLNDLYEDYLNDPKKIPYQLWNPGTMLFGICAASYIYRKPVGMGFFRQSRH